MASRNSCDGLKPSICKEPLAISSRSEPGYKEPLKDSSPSKLVAYFAHLCLLPLRGASASANVAIDKNELNVAAR
jgi:hypothetical protein